MDGTDAPGFVMPDGLGIEIPGTQPEGGQQNDQRESQWQKLCPASEKIVIYSWGMLPAKAEGGNGGISPIQRV